ncbi:MAG: hypothetical protein JKX99_01355 [Robiginitomaculum sp.]|nr:hypothetical protein [Robiginitomaculum sp.]
MTRPTPILVLGMHRSGTSCLTGCLEEAGLFLGEVNTQADFNKKGNRENVKIMTLHDDVLAQFGATWNQPPTTRIHWSKSDLDKLARIIDQYPTNIVWGSKDPRTLLLLSGWLELTHPKFIGTFRHPVEVANSLTRRAAVWNQPMREQHAYDLWEIYNTKLLELHRQTPFDVLRFCVAPNIYQGNVEQAGARLGFTVPQPLKFLEPRLKTQDFSQSPVPDHLRSLWDELNDIAI